MSFFTPNIIVSNPVPQEVKIYYSKDFAIVSICFLFIIIAMGAFWIAAKQALLSITACSIAFSFSIFKAKGIFNNKPQILISTSGIQTANALFYKWSEISDERVSGEYTGRGPKPMLEYTHPGGKERVKLVPLNIRPQDLDILLKYYRKPWEFRGK